MELHLVEGEDDFHLITTIVLLAINGSIVFSVFKQIYKNIICEVLIGKQVQQIYLPEYQPKHVFFEDFVQYTDNNDNFVC